MTFPPSTQNPALIVTSSGLSLFHQYPHPLLSPQALGYLEANLGHHLIMSIFISVCMSKRGERFFKKIPT